MQNVLLEYETKVKKMIDLDESLVYKLKPKECPKCGFKLLSNILYGLPHFGDELLEDIKSGKISLGGCCISDLDPAWRCTKCKATFYREEECNNDEYENSQLLGLLDFLQQRLIMMKSSMMKLLFSINN